MDRYLRQKQRSEFETSKARLERLRIYRSNLLSVINSDGGQIFISPMRTSFMSSSKEEAEILLSFEIRRVEDELRSICEDIQQNWNED